MASTVKARPNHYERLGLKPGAKMDEIAQAFARELSQPRAFGSLADITVAYETLRDPAKRQAYDSSIGLEPEPKPTPAPALSLAGRLEAAQFMNAAAAKPDPASAPALRVTPRPRPEPRPEPRTAPSATALLRQPASPSIRQAVPRPGPKFEESRRPEPVAEPRPRPRAQDERSFQPIEPIRFDDARESSINWKLPAIAAGALVLAVGAGAWTGWEAGNDNESVTVKVPSSKPLRAAPEPATAAASADLALPSVEPRKPAAPARRAARPRPPLQITLPEKQEAEVTVLEQRQRELETEQAAVESAAPSSTAAKLPLPDSVIARTIGRIGYPCGQVASAAAADGAPGVFTVTCTSGHSYRASPVRGRYHFKRLASR